MQKPASHTTLVTVTIGSKDSPISWIAYIRPQDRDAGVISTWSTHTHTLSDRPASQIKSA